MSALGRAVGLLTAILALWLASPGLAATIDVESTEVSGPGSLGAAILLEAQAGDTIQLGPGEYVLTNGEYLVAKGLTIRGAGVGETTLIPGGGGEALEDPNVTVDQGSLTVEEARQPSESGDDGGSQIETKAQIIALIGTLAFFILILELVRRRRLVERYALLWMSVAIFILILSVWTDGLDVLADAMGIAEPANAIFLLAVGAAFLLLLNFSVATSRLSEETKILAQESARLEQELREARGEVPSTNGEGPSAGSAEDAEHERPVSPQ